MNRIRATRFTEPAPPYTGSYLRSRDLPRILPLLETDMRSAGPHEQAKLVALLRHALRTERQRGRSGSWTYDLARHAALLRAYRIEAANLAQLRPPPAGQVSTPG